MSTSITLNKETAIELLYKFIESGYKNTGVISIKDGANLHRFFRIIKNQEKTDEKSPKESDIFKVIFNVIGVLNANKAYTLNDAAVIDQVMTFVEENVLSSPTAPVVVEPKDKITEI